MKKLKQSKCSKIKNGEKIKLILVRETKRLDFNSLSKNGCTQATFKVKFSKLDISNSKSNWLRSVVLFICVAFSMYSFVCIFNLRILSPISRMLFILINLVFLLKSIQTFYVMDDIYHNGDIDLVLVLVYIIPLFLIAGLFIYIFYFNISIDLVNNINFAMEDPILVALPIIISFGLVFSITKTFSKKISQWYRSKKINLKQKDIFNVKKDLVYKVFSHINLSILILLISSVLFIYLEIDLVFIIFLNIGALFIFNFCYYNYSDTYIHIDPDEPDDLDEEYWYIPLHSIFFLIIFCVFTIFYFINAFEFKILANKIFLIIFENPFLTSLTLVSFIFIIIIPGIKILYWLFIVIADFIYRKAVSRFFYSIYFVLLAIFILRIILYNLQVFNLNPVIIWLIYIIVGALTYVFALKLTFLMT